MPAPACVQGRSLWPSISGDAQDPPAYAFSGRFPAALARNSAAWTSEGPLRTGAVGPDDAAEAITVTGRGWSLVAGPAGGRSELFDLRVDPAQAHNLIANEPGVAGEMRRALTGFVERFDGQPALAELYGRAAEDSGETAGRRGRLLPESHLYTARDAEGRTLSFATADEAHRRLASPSAALERESFGAVLERDARSLVYLDAQYYWAQDLI